MTPVIPKRAGALVFASLLALTACQGSKGEAGSQGPTGPTGPTGPQGQPPMTAETCLLCHAAGQIAEPTPLHDAAANAVLAKGSIDVLSTSFTSTSAGTVVKPAVTFRLRSPAGTAVAGYGGFRTSLSRLVPATATVPEHWIRMASQRGGPHRTDAAGTFVDNGDGTYTHTLTTNIAGLTGELHYQVGDLVRVGVQVEAYNDGATQPTVYASNGVADFTGADAVVTPNATLSREIVTTAACNACHGRFSTFHKDSTGSIAGALRSEAPYCSVCHTPALGTPAGSGDLTFFIHRIHGREKLSAATAAVPVLGITPAEVTYPQKLDNCAACHQGANSARWNTNPSRYACTSCHDTVSFVSPAPAGQTIHTAGAQADDSGCGGCHSPAAIIGYHTDPTQAEAAKYQVIIDSVTATAPNQFPVVVFRIVDPTSSNTPYALTSTPFTRPQGASRLAMIIGLSNSEFTNVGTGSNFGQPVSIDLLAAGAPITGPDAAGAYTVTSPIAIPAAATGQGTVAIEGHPAFDPGTGTNLRIPMKNASRAFAITGTATTARRAVVDVAKCNRCHFNLSLHGNNRTGDITTCTICHNTEATDGSRRPNFTTAGTLGVDGKLEEGIDFKYLIHSIHGTELSGAGVVVYGYGNPPSIHDFREVKYPQVLSNCQACHFPATYLQPQAAANGTSVFAGADRVGAADNLRTTKYKATCGACHAQGLGGSHITQNGGTTDVTQAQIDAVNR